MPRKRNKAKPLQNGGMIRFFYPRYVRRDGSTVGGGTGEMSGAEYARVYNKVFAAREAYWAESGWKRVS